MKICNVIAKMHRYMIKRTYTKILKETIKDYPIILLTGPRQIGKSTLVYNELNNYNYVSLDNTLDLAMARSDPKTFLSLHDAPLIIDEAQNAPELFPELEHIVNEIRLKKGNTYANGMYVLSGSQRKKLLDKSKESLSGRVAILDMSNLSINEIFKRDNLSFNTENISSISKRSSKLQLNEKAIFEYIVRGFFQHFMIIQK